MFLLTYLLTMTDSERRQRRTSNDGRRPCRLSSSSSTTSTSSWRRWRRFVEVDASSS